MQWIIMDVDAMSTEKWNTLMRKGACFIYEETGGKSCLKLKKVINRMKKA